MTVAPRRWYGPGAAVTALSGAAALAGAAFLPWWQRRYADPLTGPLTVTVDGASVWAALVPIALVVVAGYGAAALSSGVLRRAIGVVLTGLSVVTVIAAIRAVATTPAGAFADRLVRPASPLAAATVHLAGPVVGIAGAILALCAGLIIAMGPAPARSRAYDSPAARHDADHRAPRTSQQSRSGATDGADLWRTLDAGDDPTADDPTP